MSASPSDVLHPARHAAHDPKGRRLRRWPWLLLLAGLLLLVAAGAVWFASSVSDEGMEPNVVVGSLEGYTDEELAALLADRVEEGMIAFSLNTQMVLDGPDGRAQVLFENPANNAKLLRLVLVRDDTGQQLYATGYVAPGSYVDEAAFEVPLEPGAYSCTATITSYREDTKKLIGEVAAEVTVTVMDAS